MYVPDLEIGKEGERFSPAIVMANTAIAQQ
jgi:hypothetical protein